MRYTAIIDKIFAQDSARQKALRGPGDPATDHFVAKHRHASDYGIPLLALHSLAAQAQGVAIDKADPAACQWVAHVYPGLVKVYAHYGLCGAGPHYTTLQRWLQHRAEFPDSHEIRGR